MLYDLIIVGSGAAGLSAALYAGRYKIKTLVLGHEFGGETAKAGVIWNYPGNKGIDGYELMEIMKAQAQEVGSEIKYEEVEKLEKNGGRFVLTTQKGTYHAKTLILSMGAERRHLGLSNEKELTGKGVHYCMTCDGPVYSGKTIAMVGGGDASVKGINLASEYVSKIYFLVRGAEIIAEPINFEQMQKLGDKVVTLLETEVVAIEGNERFEKVVLSRPYQGSTDLLVDGLFIEIGAKPNKDLPALLGVTLDSSGYVLVDNMMKTNVEGIFAAGDATNFFGRFKQDITAAAMGAVAATSAYEHLKRLS